MSSKAVKKIRTFETINNKIKGMSANISKKEVIISLYESGKTLDEIQASIIMLFLHEPIPSIDVNI
jgi:hypothetical protein